MFIWTKFACPLFAVAMVPALLLGQSPVEPKIEFGGDSPIEVISSHWGESKSTPRGGAMVIDLKSALVVRNRQPRKIRAVTLVVLAQDATPGGKGSIAIASLNAGPGETFPIKIDMRLLRPLDSSNGPLVRVKIDGILFDDMSFYGENRLNSLRSMTMWEMEARRDRKYFKSVLEARGPEGLNDEVMASIAREKQRPKVDVQFARGTVAMPASVLGESRQVQFSFLRFPDAPVELMEGSAKVQANEAHLPGFTVRNNSKSAVRFLDIGWIVKDGDGREFVAGTLPADVTLNPGSMSHVSQRASLKFTEAGKPLSIQGMTGFVKHVEYSDGTVWIPNRVAASDAQLSRAAGQSPEEQRLTDLYRRRGIKGLTEELKKF